jgi:hypothetical protein
MPIDPVARQGLGLRPSQVQRQLWLGWWPAYRAATHCQARPTRPIARLSLRCAPVGRALRPIQTANRPPAAPAFRP